MCACVSDREIGMRVFACVCLRMYVGVCTFVFEYVCMCVTMFVHKHAYLCNFIKL